MVLTRAWGCGGRSWRASSTEILLRLARRRSLRSMPWGTCTRNQPLAVLPAPRRPAWLPRPRQRRPRCAVRPTERIEHAERDGDGAGRGQRLSRRYVHLLGEQPAWLTLRCGDDPGWAHHRCPAHALRDVLSAVAHCPAARRGDRSPERERRSGERGNV